MLYAILAYHVEDVVESWSSAEDAALMRRLEEVRLRLEADGVLGPAARLGNTADAVTLRAGVVLDGPFAETKEQLLGLYVVDVADRDAAVAAARELQVANPGAVYEIRAIRLYLPSVAAREVGGTDAT